MTRASDAGRVGACLLAALWIAAAVAACAGTPPRSGAPAAAANERPLELYVVRRGWHVDIGFAASGLHAPLAAVNARLPGVRYVLFGFGDRRYLMTRDQGSCTGLAALWPGPGLILVTGLATTPALAFSERQVIRIEVTAAQELAAEAFVWRSMAGGDAPVEPVATGPYDGSVYFSARPRYSGVYTCNTWAAEALRAAGLPVRSAGVVLAGQIWRQAQRCQASEAGRSSVDRAPCAVTTQ